MESFCSLRSILHNLDPGLNCELSTKILKKFVGETILNKQLKTHNKHKQNVDNILAALQICLFIEITLNKLRFFPYLVVLLGIVIKIATVIFLTWNSSDSMFISNLENIVSF